MTLLAWVALAGALAAQNPPAQINPSVLPPPPEETPVDPYLANRSFDIGMHYFKWRNYDAAISRFHEAIKHKPDHARAHMMLGETHEKKGELKEAVQFYKKFLEILPNAPEAGKVKKQIARLEARMAKSSKK